MNILNEVYDELHRYGLVTSHCQFSTEWLNKSRRYMSMIRASDREPSVDALARLAANLKHMRDTCRESRYGQLRQKALWLDPIARRVWSEFYRRSLDRQIL